MIRTSILLATIAGGLALAGSAFAQATSSGSPSDQGAPATAAPNGRVGARGSPSTVPPGAAEPEGAASALVGADRPFQDPTLPGAAAAAGAAQDASARVPATPEPTADKSKKKKGSNTPPAQPRAPQ